MPSFDWDVLERFLCGDLSWESLALLADDSCTTVLLNCACIEERFFGLRSLAPSDGFCWRNSSRVLVDGLEGSLRG